MYIYIYIYIYIHVCIYIYIYGHVAAHEGGLAVLIALDGAGGLVGRPLQVLGAVQDVQRRGVELRPRRLPRPPRRRFGDGFLGDRPWRGGAVARGPELPHLLHRHLRRAAQAPSDGTPSCLLLVLSCSCLFVLCMCVYVYIMYIMLYVILCAYLFVYVLRI